MLPTLLLALVPLMAQPTPSLRHWATRDFEIVCGEPLADRLSVYRQAIAAGRDLDLLSPLAKQYLPRPLGCVPAASKSRVLGELALLVDHFDGWGIRPNLPAFDFGDATRYRLYVRDLDVPAKVNSPYAAQIPLSDAALSVNADPVEAFGAKADPDLVRYFLAHELTHVMQRSSPLYHDSPAASVDDDEGDWVTEGMADTVGLHWMARRSNGLLRPTGVPDMVHTPVGTRPYHLPLPITDAGFSTVAPHVAQAKVDLHAYRTSSFWRYVLERLGRDDPRYFARLLTRRAPRWREGKRTHWLRWLDEGLRQQSSQSLSRTFGAFLPEYLSWGFSRFAGWGFSGKRGKRDDVSPVAWMKRGFDGCISVAVTPDAPADVTLRRIAAMSGRCLIVAVKASGYHVAGLDILTDAQPTTVAAGLHLGLARGLGAGTWDCYGQTERGAVRDCLQTPRRLRPVDGAQRTTWTVQPQRLGAHDQIFFYLALASFPERHQKAWLDRTDDVALRIGVRAARLEAKTPTTRPGQVPLVGPLSAGLTGISTRGVRPALPIDAALPLGDGAAYAAAMMFAPEALGTTGLPTGITPDGPAGLPGLTLLAWRDGEITPDQMHLLVFGGPVPLGFRGRTGAALSSNLDPSRAPPLMGWPADRSTIPVEVDFTADRLAMRFDAPICIADLEAIGLAPDPATLQQHLCAQRGAVAADVVVPFGEFYVLGSAAALDPADVTWPDDDGEPAGEGRTPEAPAAGTDAPTADAVAAAAGALAPCACTCERLAQFHADMQAVGLEAQAILTAMTPEELAARAEADEEPLPMELRARMQALEGFDACIDRCAEDFARCP